VHLRFTFYGRLEYGKAFSACRKHRIDLSILVDQNPVQFMDKLQLFLQEVPEVDDLNLFLTTFGYLFSFMGEF
jgi:elongator complex protein 1